MSQKILFFGNERLATGVTTTAPTLQALAEAGYEITGVVIAQDEIGPSRKIRPLEVAKVATSRGIPVLSPSKLADAADQFAAMRADIGVLAAYGELVPPVVLDSFPLGIVNIHPSLLPKHRGPTPIESVILNGETETGVSLMRVAKELDAGPIYAQQSLKLTGRETKQALADKLQSLSVEMLLDALPDILSGTGKPQPQDDSQATYDQKIDRSAGVLDFSQPAVQLEREVRAFAGWPRSQTKVGSTDIVVTRATVAPGSGQPGTLWRQGKQLGFYTTDGILVIESLIPAGKKEMSAEAFLAGYRSKNN